MSAPHRMAVPPVAAVLSDGRRHHFQHGPINLVIEAFGAPAEIEGAYRQAWDRFETILDELVGELPALRSPVTSAESTVEGAVARSMHHVCAPHRETYVTPMAAVAGAVADAVLAAMTAGRSLDRAYVNNGGDIALFLSPGESFTSGIVTLGERARLDGLSRIDAASAVRGIATSGWRGRSFSLGIAESVTVLAHNAAEADVAATLIANAVDVDDPAITREPATAHAPDSDLGDRLVTIAVDDLPQAKTAHALDRGVVTAEDMLRRGLIVDALITVQGRSRVIGRSRANAA